MREQILQYTSRVPSQYGMTLEDSSLIKAPGRLPDDALFVERVNDYQHHLALLEYIVYV